MFFVTTCYRSLFFFPPLLDAFQHVFICRYKQISSSIILGTVIRKTGLQFISSSFSEISLSFTILSMFTLLTMTLNSVHWSFLKLMFSWLCMSCDNPDTNLSVIQGKIDFFCRPITLSSSHQIQTSTVDRLPSLQFSSIFGEWRWVIEKKRADRKPSEKKKVYFLTANPLRIPITIFYENISLSWKNIFVSVKSLNENVNKKKKETGKK